MELVFEIETNERLGDISYLFFSFLFFFLNNLRFLHLMQYDFIAMLTILG